ncbi:hypothetical protein SCB29_33780 [Paraburkholderia sp. SIMBA_055]
MRSSSFFQSAVFFIAGVFFSAAEGAPVQEIGREMWANQFATRLRANPEKAVYVIEGSLDYRRANLMKTADHYSIDLPLRLSKEVESYTGIKGVNLIYETYKSVVKSPREKQREELLKYYYSDPTALIDLGRRSYDILRQNDSSSLSDRQKGFSTILKSEIARGTFDPPQVANRATIENLPKQGLSGRVREKLLLKSDEALTKVLDSDQNFRGFFDSEIGAADAALSSAVIDSISRSKEADTMSETITSFRSSVERAERQEKQAQLLADQRGAILISSTLLGFVDPKAAKILDVGGNAMVDASAALKTIAEDGLTIAATGNIFAAAMTIAQLFSGAPDPQSARHQQLVDMLSRVGEQIADLSQRVALIDENVRRVLLGIDELKSGQTASTAALMSRLDALSQQMQAGFQSNRTDHAIILSSSFHWQVLACKNMFPADGNFVDTGESPIGIRLADCLSSFESHATQNAKTATFTYKDIDLQNYDLANLEKMEPFEYIGILPQIIDKMPWAGALSATYQKSAVAATFADLPNQQALTDGVIAYIELRRRRSEYPYPNDATILAGFADEIVQYLSSIDTAFSILNVPGLPAAQPYLESLSKLDDKVRGLSTEYLNAEAKSQHPTVAERNRTNTWDCQLIYGLSSNNEACQKRRADLYEALDPTTKRETLLLIFQELGNLTARAGPYLVNPSWGITPPSETRTANGFVISWQGCVELGIVSDSSPSDPLGLHLFKNPRAGWLHTWHYEQKCDTWTAGPASTAGDAKQALMKRIKEEQAKMRQNLADPANYKPPPGQWLSSPGRELEIAKQLQAAHRQRANSWLAQKIANRDDLEIETILRSLDTFAFSWQFMEKFGYGGCFESIAANYTLFDASPRYLLLAAEARSLLAAGQVPQLLERIKSIREGTTVVVLNGQEVKVKTTGANRIQKYDERACTRYPAELVSALESVREQQALASRRFSTSPSSYTRH